MLLLVLFYVCFGLGEKFPTPSATTSDSRNLVLHTRAPESRTVASSLSASLCFLSASESEPQSPAGLPSAPALAKVRQVPLGMRKTPYAPRAHAGRAASCPRPEQPRISRRPEREENSRTGRPRTRTLRASARLATCCPRVFRRAERLASSARMKRVYRDEKELLHWSAARNKERFSPRL